MINPIGIHDIDDEFIRHVTAQILVDPELWAATNHNSETNEDRMLAMKAIVVAAIRTAQGHPPWHSFVDELHRYFTSGEEGT